jgi:hypothetical protein
VPAEEDRIVWHWLVTEALDERGMWLSECLHQHGIVEAELLVLGHVSPVISLVM